MGRHFKDVTGQRFGMRVAMWPVGYSPNGKVAWLCLCDCGNYHPTSSFRYAPTCGCVGRAKAAQRIRLAATGRAKPGERRALRHGLSITPVHDCWQGAKARCKRDPRYIAKGIEFRFTSFEQWFAELGHRPEGEDADGRALYSVDRINNRRSLRTGQRSLVHEAATGSEPTSNS